MDISTVAATSAFSRGFDILPDLRSTASQDGDSFYKTLMSERENVLCGVHVAVMQYTALLTSPFSYS